MQIPEVDVDSLAELLEAGASLLDVRQLDDCRGQIRGVSWATNLVLGNLDSFTGLKSVYKPLDEILPLALPPIDDRRAHD